MTPLDRAVREARSQLGKDEAERVDWSAVDRGLFERIAEERRVDRARFAPSRVRPWQSAALAAAAGVIVFALAERDGKKGRAIDVAPALDQVAGTVESIEGDGQVRIGGVAAVRGVVVREGDVIDARGAQATIERAGKVTFRL